MEKLLKKGIKLIVEIIIILLIAFALLKVADHFFGLYSKIFWVESAKEEKDYRQPDKVFHHSLIPNSCGVHTRPEYKVKYKINSFGFRDKESKLEKPDDTFRIIMVGDSFVEGYGAELKDTFTKVLEGKLNNKNQEYEVINAGVVSYSPIIEYLLIKNKLLGFNPDLIMLVFFAGSDVCDDHGYAALAKFDSNNLPVCVSPPAKSVENFKEQSWPKRFFYYELQIIAKIKNFILRGFKKARHRSFFYGDIIPEKNVVIGNESDWKGAWERTKGYLKAIDDLLEKKNIEFAIVMLPPGHHVNGKEWDIGRKFFDYRVGQTYKNPLYEYMDKFCRENNIYFCNLLDCFQASGVYPIYYRGDGHLTVHGNKLAADYLYDFLKKNNLIGHQP